MDAFLAFPWLVGLLHLYKRLYILLCYYLVNDTLYHEFSQPSIAMNPV